ncbi:deoxyribose-phosphate aldolase, partial [Kitasatospora sp. NPDC058115]
MGYRCPGGRRRGRAARGAGGRRGRVRGAGGARRTRRPLLSDTGRLMIVAADHPARGALGG